MANPEIAVEMGRDALDSDWSQNWYDDNTDSLRPLKVRVPKPKAPPKNPGGGTGGRSGFWDWMDGWLHGIHPSLDVAALLKFFAWTALLIALVMIAMWLMRVYIRDERKRFAQVNAVDPRATNVDRVEALPLAVDESISDFLAEARRRYQSGDLSGAIVYLFSHQLLELDRHHLVRLVKGKTNRQYLREIKRNAAGSDQLHGIVKETITLFEEVFFGKRETSQAAVASCWNQTDQFAQLVQAAAREEEQA
jgi:hypothetical protein